MAAAVKTNTPLKISPRLKLRGGFAVSGARSAFSAIMKGVRTEHDGLKHRDLHNKNTTQIKLPLQTERVSIKACEEGEKHPRKPKEGGTSVSVTSEIACEFEANRQQGDGSDSDQCHNSEETSSVVWFHCRQQSNSSMIMQNATHRPISERTTLQPRLERGALLLGLNDA